MSALAGLTERREGDHGAASPSRHDAAGPTLSCWVCGTDEQRGPPIDCGCGCVGLAGYVHLDCAVEAARQDWERWFDCKSCGQRWTGNVKLGLARARLELMSDRPEHDAERKSAEEMLSDALRDARELVRLSAEREALRKRQSSAPDDRDQEETQKGMVV